MACFGLEVATVLHEVVSDRVHVDVHVCPPGSSRPYYTLFTTGMADLPMTVPSGNDGPQRAELMLCLPPDWPLEHAAFGDERNYWPLRLLKSLARLPHDYQTWLGVVAPSRMVIHRARTHRVLPGAAR